MGAENATKDIWPKKKIKMAGESDLMMNCWLCIENQIL